jgi:ATPase involved in DNA repair
MDRQIPELLGVSQAVLDNVIFCHQEESLWPFGDTAKLKSIFDELFDTTSYTNLLENLKKIKKEYKKAAKDTLTEFQLEKKDFDQLLRVSFLKIV